MHDMSKSKPTQRMYEHIPLKQLLGWNEHSIRAATLQQSAVKRWKVCTAAVFCNSFVQIAF
jgi:hypothetical protein